MSSFSASDTAAQLTAALPSCARDGGAVDVDANRQIVKVDRLPDFLGKPFLTGVDAAHRPLELGELANHVGGEIGLRQARRMTRGLRRRFVGAERGSRDRAGELLDPLELVFVAAQSFL